MPDDEADHCVHCDKVLRAPPDCCEKADRDWMEQEEKLDVVISRIMIQQDD